MQSRDPSAPGANLPEWRHQAAPWLAVWLLTFGLTALTTVQAWTQYHEFRTGWGWDLAYYNQWFWALTHGDQTLSVRPVSSYAVEGPSVWKTNYLAPIRFLIAPLYALFPDPRTLLLVQNVLFWWVVPAAFTLAWSESGSAGAGLAACALVPLTPLVWPLVANDFRELQLAIPFVLWAIQGYRNRDRRLTVASIAVLLACRQEYAVVVASLAALPPRRREDIGTTYRWTESVLLVGVTWVVFVFFGYLKWVVGPNAADHYLDQFLGSRAAPGETLATALDFLAVGMGSWALLALLAPRIAVLAVPWVWSLAGGKWALRLLATSEWHHVRYAAPFVGLLLAAGAVGYARLAGWLRARPGGRWWLAAAWLTAALGLLLADREVATRLNYVPEPIPRSDVVDLWHWVRRVGPEDGVLAAYEVAAPLSSRQLLFSYVLDQNKPLGYPRLLPEIRWVFCRRGDLPDAMLTSQGFRLVFRGLTARVWHRP